MCRPPTFLYSTRSGPRAGPLPLRGPVLHITEAFADLGRRRTAQRDSDRRPLLPGRERREAGEADFFANRSRARRRGGSTASPRQATADASRSAGSACAIRRAWYSSIVSVCSREYWLVGLSTNPTADT